MRMMRLSACIWMIVTNMLRRFSFFLPSKKSQVVFIHDSPTVNVPIISLPRHGKSPITLTLDPNKSIWQLIEQQSRRQIFKTLELYSLHGTKYSSSTLLSEVLSEPFNIVVDNQQTFCVVNHEIDKVSLPYAPEDKVLSDKYFWEHGLSARSAEVLAFFNRNLIDNLNLLENTKVSRDLLRTLTNKVVLERANEYRNYVKTLTSHIEALEDIYVEELRFKAEIEAAAEKSSDRKYTAFVSVIGTQFLGVQYGTYYLFSWDIMEPITCMMAMGDTFFAYWFWMRSQHSYDADGLRSYFYNKKLDKLYRKSRFNRSEVEQVNQLIQSLKEKRQEFIS